MFNIFKKNEKNEKIKTNKPKQDNYYEETKVELPVNFAQNVMDLEMQL
jgi:hypothetical protein